MVVAAHAYCDGRERVAYAFGWLWWSRLVQLTVRRARSLTASHSLARARVYVVWQVGGGLYNDGGNMTLVNSTVANNTAGQVRAPDSGGCSARCRCILLLWLSRASFARTCARANASRVWVSVRLVCWAWRRRCDGGGGACILRRA